MDVVGIPGGHVENVHHATISEYRGLGRPIDVCMLAGLNNLAAGHPPEMILYDIQAFKEEVMKIPGSSFAACTLPLPPSMSRLREDNYVTRHDRGDDLKELNFLIREENTKGGGDTRTEIAPLFHTWGLRSRPRPRNQDQDQGPRNLMELLPSHRGGDWRESQPWEQLHLHDRVRLRMGRAVLSYYKVIYGIQD
jgi:hypothetical protein